MATSNQDRAERAELERERADDEISPAQPLGPDRIDDDKHSNADHRRETAHVKSGDRNRMEN